MQMRACATDLLVFNGEVDPKAIEAAANEEPPAYEPTNVEPKETERTDKIVGKNASQDQWEEVVEEDADEEARAAAATSTSSKLAWLPCPATTRLSLGAALGPVVSKFNGIEASSKPDKPL